MMPVSSVRLTWTLGKDGTQQSADQSDLAQSDTAGRYKIIQKQLQLYPGKFNMFSVEGIKSSIRIYLQKHSWNFKMCFDEAPSFQQIPDILLSEA